MRTHESLKVTCWASALACVMVVNLFGQEPLGNYVPLDSAASQGEIIRKAANVTPSPRQYEWQSLEMTGFVHFGINTFDEVEWGQRNTDITQFNPTELDVKQWVKVFQEAGIKTIILTCKHHDGFCLWPSAFTDYTIAHTPFQNGQGDIVRDLAHACHEAGMRFGIYLSPWDMHEKSYGTAEYNTHFLNQLSELLTNYGEISEVWFDGANGEGPKGRRQEYDWKSFYALIRKLQPRAVISVMGPDIRWVGTESGYGRQTEWSVLPGSSFDQGKIAAHSQQQSLDGAFVPRDLIDDDLGSRGKLQGASSLVWYPAEIDVSIRPGWFYKTGEDNLVKTPEKLVDIYYNSVGLNGVLLLNVPPDKRGIITSYDVKSLQGMRHILDETFKENFAGTGTVRASHQAKGHDAAFILDNDPTTYWTTESGDSKATIEITLEKMCKFNRAMLQENIRIGQRIEKFHLESWTNGDWKTFARATTIGYKRLLRFPVQTTSRIRIVIDECRTNPTLASFGLFMAPPEVEFVPGGESFGDSLRVAIQGDTTDIDVYYTLDGSLPTTTSTKWSGSISLNSTTTLSALAVSRLGKVSVPIQTTYHKAKYRIEYVTPYDPKYPGAGPYTLVDGANGSTNFNDGCWQGFNGSDLEVTVDLGKVISVDELSARFLRDINSFIFLPTSVEYDLSDDGKDFRILGTVQNDLPQNERPQIIKDFRLKSGGVTGRYVRVKAHNMGVCPSWHKGAGEKAWIFVDEIAVE